MAQSSALPAPVTSPLTATTSAPPATGLDLGPPKADSRDVIVGVVALVVLAAIFFVIKNAYANWRVRERVAPSRANTSGWFLFLTLLLVAAIAVLAFINAGQFMAPLYLAPLGSLAAASLVAWLMTFSAKR